MFKVPTLIHACIPPTVREDHYATLNINRDSLGSHISKNKKLGTQWDITPWDHISSPDSEHIIQHCDIYTSYIKLLPFLTHTTQDIPCCINDHIMFTNDYYEDPSDTYTISRQYGGGQETQNMMQSTNTGNQNTHKISFAPQWTTIAEGNVIDINQLAFEAPNFCWNPPIQLPYKNLPHPLADTIDDKLLQQLQQACQHTNDIALLRSNRSPSIAISSDDLRDLISHGSPINDQVITLYLELISTTYDMPHLSTFFFDKLTTNGWTRVQNFFANRPSRTRHRSAYRPNLQGEPCIIIPIHIQGFHWVALVRREINNRVYFLYHDDMNNTNVEHDIKRTLQNHTCPEFYPSSTTWITCQGYYYIPHSNECGPRTLLALHVMATHTNPHKHILLPFMHPNIAQISRTWIASSLISGTLIKIPSNHLSDTTTPSRQLTSLTMTSVPYDLISWKYTMTDHSNNNTSQDQDSTSSSTATPGSCNISQYQGRTPTNNPHINPDVYDTGHQLLSPPISQCAPPNQKQRSILQWATPRHAENIVIDDPPLINAPITPYGTQLPPISHTNTLRIIMQNTQYAMQLPHNTPDHIDTILNLKQLDASIFVAISPNVNWYNASNTVAFKKSFQQQYKQIHISSATSRLGKDKQYFNRQTLQGGVAVVTFDHWASKVSSTTSDPREHGTYAVTTIRGKNGRLLSIIGAYISVNKGTTVGPNTVHAQQMTIMEQDALKQNRILPPDTCPRKEAIKALGQIIEDLQKKQHSIILLIDANQTPGESKSKNATKKYSIKWLCETYGMTDPFIELLNNRPNTTTLTPGRDIDYILTYGLNIQNISTLGINMPARSDHQGIGIDICTEELFTGRYSTLHQQPRRLLTLNNVRAKITYVKYITDAVVQHNLLNRLIDLYKIAMEGNFNDSHESQLNQLDRQLTDILLCGESKCAKNHRSRHAWSPQLRTAGRTLVYWKQKTRMANKKMFHWNYLDNLRTNTDISSEDHLCMDIHKIHQCLCSARKRWKDIKQRSHELRNQFLSELADEHAAKMRTNKETALKAILRTEEAKQTYANIQTIVGNKKEKTPFTQVDIRCPTTSTNTITLTTKHEIEEAIIKRNQLHARQALQTPFASTQGLSDAINPNNPNNSIEKILHGSFLNELPPEIDLSGPERVWIQELQLKLQGNVDIYISPDDFKFFLSTVRNVLHHPHQGATWDITKS
jgi:hypothetical protein